MEETTGAQKPRLAFFPGNRVASGMWLPRDGSSQHPLQLGSGKETCPDFACATSHLGPEGASLAPGLHVVLSFYRLGRKLHKQSWGPFFEGGRAASAWPLTACVERRLLRTHVSRCAAFLLIAGGSRVPGLLFPHRHEALHQRLLNSDYCM